MRKVIMMFALAMGIVTAHAQENATVAEENNGSEQQTDAQPVLTKEVYPQKEADGDLYHGLTKKLTFDRMIPPHGLEVTYDKTVHIIFPAEVRYVDLGSPDLIAGKADGAENVIRVKATVRNFPNETNMSRLNYGVHGKRYFAVGFPNVAGGYEIRSRHFKGCVPPKDVSLIRTEAAGTDACCVYEGFMDFLSAVTLGIGERCDHLVLNSVANVKKALRYLDGYGRIGCFLDRDDAGRRTLEALKERYGGRVADRSALYDGCKDLNEHLQRTTKKQNINHLKIK